MIKYISGVLKILNHLIINKFSHTHTHTHTHIYIYIYIRWNCIAKILKDEGATPKVMGKFYITIVQAVLLYGAESWVIKKRDYIALRSFHRRAVRYMSGKHIRKHEYDEWEYPNHEELLRKCGLVDINIYIERRRGTLRNYLEKYRKDLLDRAEKSKRHARDVNRIMWWTQPWLSRNEMKNHERFWFQN